MVKGEYMKVHRSHKLARKKGRCKQHFRQTGKGVEGQDWAGLDLGEMGAQRQPAA